MNAWPPPNRPLQSGAASASPENERSKAVARRLGGHLDKNIPFRDDVADMFVYDLAMLGVPTKALQRGFPRELIELNGRDERLLRLDSSHKGVVLMHRGLA